MKDEARLQKGPAYEIENPKSQIQNATDWPTYRHDAARSGGTPTALPQHLSQKWATRIGNSALWPVSDRATNPTEGLPDFGRPPVDGSGGVGDPRRAQSEKWATRIGGRLTAPVVAEGLVFVASADEHTLYALPTDQTSWRMRVPLRPQAMALAGDHLLLAGPPDSPHPRDALASLEGRQGGALWILSTADGRKTAEWKLDAPPVYDGLAIAGGRLYWSGTDGRIRCWAEGSE